MQQRYTMSTNLSSFFEQVFNEATALEVYQQTHAGKLPMGVFLGLLKLDPTAIVAEGENEEVALNGSKKGAYTDWLVRQYKAAGEGAQARFLTEDAAQIRKYLEVYKALTTNKEGVAKLQRSVEQQGLQIANIKDLNEFKLASLAQVLTPFMKESSEDLAVREENKITVVYNDPVWQVVIPLTHAASRKFGTGTHWCTATSSSSYFNNYSKQGPLFIIRAKQIQGNDCRWQYHKQSSQFMDWRDYSISIRRFLLTFLPRWPAETTAMANAIKVAAGSSGWDPERFQKDAAKEIEKIKKAIADVGNDVDEAVVNKSPILIYAIARNNIDLLDMLLTQYHADPVVYDAKGNSALSLAISAGLTDAVKMLLQAGSPEMMLSQRGVDGNTPIHEIAQSLNLPLLNSVLERLSTPQLRLTYLNTRNNYRQTPLMRAINNNDANENEVLEVVKLIVEAMEAGVQGATATQLAETVRRFIEDDTAEDLVEKPARHILDLRDLSGYTAAVYALRRGFIRVYEYLTQHGSDINAARREAVTKAFENFDSNELRGFISTGVIFTADIFKTIPVTISFLEKLSQIDAGDQYEDDDDPSDTGTTPEVLANKTVQAFDYFMKLARESPAANAKRSANVHFHIPTGPGAGSYGLGVRDSLAHQLGDCMENAVQRGNLPLVKYLHETWQVSFQPCGDAAGIIGDRSVRSDHQRDGYYLLVSKSGRLGFKQLSFSVIKAMLDYFDSHGGDMQRMFKYYSDKDNAREFFSDIDDKELLIYLLERAEKLSPAMLKGIFSGKPLHKILRFFWHEIYNPNQPLYKDERILDHSFEDTGEKMKLAVPEANIPEILAQYLPLMELAIKANPKCITAEGDFISYRDRPILAQCVAHFRPVRPDLLEWLLAHGAKPDAAVDHEGSIYGTVFERFADIMDNRIDALSMAQVVEVTKEYRGYFILLKKLIKRYPMLYNLKIEESGYRGEDVTLLDKMLRKARDNVKLARNSEYMAWIREVRDDGGKLLTELRAEARAAKQQAKAPVDATTKPKKPTLTPYEKIQRDIEERARRYDDEDEEL